MSKIISFVGKEGVGKTTTCLNVGVCLASFGRNVVLVDANFKTPNVGMLLGASRPESTLNQALRGEKKITDTIYQHPSGLKVVLSSVALSESQEAYKNLQATIKDLRRISDVILVDTGEPFSREASELSNISDETVIVTIPELPHIIDSFKIAKKFGDATSFIVNRSTNAFELSHQNIKQMLKLEHLGSIREHNMREAMKLGHPIAYTNPEIGITMDYKKIAAQLVGQHYSGGEDRRTFNYLMRRIGLKEA